MVNVRMQNDTKLPMEQRRNYRNCFEALYRIYRTEGYMRLHTGTVMASSRGKFDLNHLCFRLLKLNSFRAISGMLMTVGQLAFYDEVKNQLLKTGYFKDNVTTHFTPAISAASAATVITMPLDVLKTRLMNAKPGEYSGKISAV